MAPNVLIGGLIATIGKSVWLKGLIARLQTEVVSEWWRLHCCESQWTDCGRWPLRRPGIHWQAAADRRLQESPSPLCADYERRSTACVHLPEWLTAPGEWEVPQSSWRKSGQWCLINNSFRQPDILVGGLRFYRDSVFFFFCLLFARYPRSLLNGTQQKPATCSEVSTIWKCMPEIWGIPSPYKWGPQNTFLTTSKHDHNFNGLYLRNETWT